MKLKNILTPRLILVPVTLEITQSLLDGSSKEIEILGFKTHDNWPREDTMDILPIINKTLQEERIPSGFEFWMIIKKDSMKVIGDIGFHGKPNEKGEVEVGFGLVKQERGIGFGYEALKTIIGWLESQRSVKVIKADCLLDNEPSKRILEKAGMEEIYRDHELIHWELVKQES